MRKKPVTFTLNAPRSRKNGGTCSKFRRGIAEVTPKYGCDRNLRLCTIVVHGRTTLSCLLLRDRRGQAGRDRRRDRAGCALEDCVEAIRYWSAAARAVRKDVLALCHGRPISSPDDAAYVLSCCPECHGFYGA